MKKAKVNFKGYSLRKFRHVKLLLSFVAILLFTTNLSAQHGPTDPYCKTGIDSLRKHYRDTINAPPIIKKFTEKFKYQALNKGGWTDIIGDPVMTSFLETEEKKPHCGLMLWFCLINGHFSIAYHKVSDLSDDPNYNPYNLLKGGVNYQVSTCSMPYAAENDFANLKELKQTIKKCCTSCTENPTTIDSAQIVKYSKEFKDSIEKVYPHSCKYPVGFIHKKQIKELLRQNDAGEPHDKCKGTRLFWAYEGTRNAKIKVVLFGIDTNNKTIWRKHKVVMNASNQITRSTYSKGVILEKSWPPN